VEFTRETRSSESLPILPPAEKAIWIYQNSGLGVREACRKCSNLSPASFERARKATEQNRPIGKSGRPSIIPEYVTEATLSWLDKEYATLLPSLADIKNHVGFSLFLVFPCGFFSLLDALHYEKRK
jgi:hypothetical protein